MRLAGDFSCAFRGHDLKSSTMIVNCDSWSRGYQCSGNVKMTQLSCRKMTPPWTPHLLSTSSSAAGTRVLWIHPRKCPDTSLTSPSTCPENWVSIRAHFINNKERSWWIGANAKRKVVYSSGAKYEFRMYHFMNNKFSQYRPIPEWQFLDCSPPRT